MAKITSLSVLQTLIKKLEEKNIYCKNHIESVKKNHM